MYLTNHYVGLHTMVVNVALAVAGLAAASLLNLPPAYHGYALLLWLMFVASLLAIAVAYAGTVTGAPVLPPKLPSMPDLILPLALALSELFLLGVLAHQFVSFDSPRSVVIGWSVGLAIFAVLAAASVARAEYLVRKSEYGHDIADVVRAYRSNLRTDVAAALLVGVVAVLSAVYHWLGSGKPSWLSYLFVALVAAAFLGGFYSHAKSRELIHRAMDE
jgi:hypothetical protein